MEGGIDLVPLLLLCKLIFCFQLTFLNQNAILTLSILHFLRGILTVLAFIYYIIFPDDFVDITVDDFQFAGISSRFLLVDPYSAEKAIDLFLR